MAYPNNSLLIYEGTIETGIYGRSFIENLTGYYEKWTHTISALGGYESASFTILGSKQYLQDWFKDGLMRRVKYLNPQGICVFEGYISKLTYSFDTEQLTRSIENMSNRIYLRYVRVDPDTRQPLADDPVTIVMNEPASQRRFGVKALVESVGGLTDAEAYAYARFLVERHSQIKTTKKINTSGSSTPSIKVDVKGYYNTLDWIPYISNNESIDFSHRIAEQIAIYFSTINPGFISLDFGLIDFNFLQIGTLYQDYKSCKNILETLQRGASGERWIIGINQDRTLYYKPAETLGELYNSQNFLVRSLEDPQRRIFEEGLGVVEPWDVRPDRILRTVDYEITG